MGPSRDALGGGVGLFYRPVPLTMRAPQTQPGRKKAAERLPKNRETWRGTRCFSAVLYGGVPDWFRTDRRFRREGLELCP